MGKYVVKNSKSNVQDAHEGIRPSDINLVPDEIKGYLTNEQYKLYKLILGQIFSFAVCSDAV